MAAGPGQMGHTWEELSGWGRFGVLATAVIVIDGDIGVVILLYRKIGETELKT